MKGDVLIKFYSHAPVEITSADKAELIPVGHGVLSIVKGDTGYFYSLDDIMMYTLREREDSECQST